MVIARCALLVIMSVSVYAAGYAQTLRESVLNLLKDYSPTGFYIVDSYENAPEYVEWNMERRKIFKNDFMTFVTGDSIASIPVSINTLVHEVCHSYILVKSYEKKDRSGKSIPGYNALYLGDGMNVFVKKTQIFKTEEIAPTIPEPLRTFRFPGYVLGKNIGSNVSGVYGLLDEYHAYYHGTRTAYDFYEYYRDELGPDLEKWHTYLREVNKSIAAAMEFKYFILKYLQYAKARYPKIYKEILANKDFITAFSGVEKNWEKLITDFSVVKEKVYDLFREDGYEVFEDEKFYYVKKGLLKTGNTHNLTDYYILYNELEKPEYQKLLNEIRRAIQ